MNCREAVDIIGTQQPDDYVIAPISHAQVYAEKATSLSIVLQQAGPQMEAEAYAKEDEKALKAQTTYRRWMGLANKASLATSTLGGLAMAWSLLPPEITANRTWLLSLLGICSFSSAALGGMSLYLLRSGQLLETWMGYRAAAETHRITYFQTVLDRAKSVQGELPILALEYFRRYQFDVQRNYYSVRSEDHLKSANVSVWIGGFGILVAFLSSAASVFPQVTNAAFNVFTVIGSALGAYAIGREQLTQDRRNAERYARTHRSLTTLGHSLDKVRVAVENSNIEALVEFANAINEQVSLEHRQWLTETEATRSVQTKIEAALKPANTKVEPQKEAVHEGKKDG